MTTTSTQCLIALGSNLGDRLENLRVGIDELGNIDGLDIDDVSKLYETAPVGGPDEQGPYLNAALTATTTIGAADLLAQLHRSRRSENVSARSAGVHAPSISTS